MAPKRSSGRDTTSSFSKAAQSSTPSKGSNPSSTPAPPALTPSKGSAKFTANQSPQEVALGIWKNYLDTTPQRTKLIDVFMAFLVLVGGLQFLYCILVGNYPFNAFLSGFSATVGQFVLTASLRIQTNPANKADFYQMSPERAFADYVFGSLILHFFCINFIN